jgi:hypothetical protein
MSICSTSPRTATMRSLGSSACVGADASESPRANSAAPKRILPNTMAHP